jgi:DNA-binding PadR family transcriptional regulator
VAELDAHALDFGGVADLEAHAESLVRSLMRRMAKMLVVDDGADEVGDAVHEGVEVEGGVEGVGEAVEEVDLEGLDAEFLEESGNATVVEEGGKRVYTITEQGKEFLAANRSSAEAAMGRMRGNGFPDGGGPAPQLIRAVQNLKMALRLRQRSGPLSEEQIRAIVTAIDAAAVAIERS